MIPELSNSGAPQDEIALLVSYYRAAGDRLRDVVLKPYGGTEKGRTFTQARAAQLVGQIDRELKGLGEKTGLWIGKNIPGAYAAGKKEGDRQAREAGVRPRGGAVQGSFSLADQGTVKVFASDTLRDLNRAVNTLGETAKAALRATAQEKVSEADINRILATGVIEGRPRETTRRLKELLESVHGEKVTINGREYDVAKYAETVVRTKTRQATVVSRHKRLQELGLDLVAIIGKVSNTFCTAFLGQVFSLSGKSSKYPAYASLPGGGPPFHPNCSKSTRPFVEQLASEQQLKDADSPPDVKKLLGGSQADAQRKFKDLQIRQQIEKKYLKSTGRDDGKVMTSTPAKGGRGGGKGGGDDALPTVANWDVAGAKPVPGQERGPGEKIPPRPT